ncbi:MAG: FtsW/RodA/SpoVE family cell cycle protein [Ktedonobacteraceae bacterium]
MASQSPSVFRRYRWTELGLLIIPFMILILEMSQLLLANQDQTSSLSTRNLPTIQGLIPALGLIAVLLFANVIMSVFFRKADQMLLPLVGLLSGIGVLMATRLGPDLSPFPDPALGSRQLVWVLLGIVICLTTLFILRNINLLARYKYTVAFLGIILVCTTLVNTFRVGLRNLDAPTHDQLNLGPLNLQPSELLKICIVIFFAAYLSENRDILAEGSLKFGPFRLPPLKQIGPLALILGIALLLGLFVRELGLALLIYGIFLAMLYLGSGKISYIVTSLFIFVGLGAIGYGLLSYVRARFAVVGIDVLHWNAASQKIYDAPGGGFQVVQGLIALSSGGILGSGLGLGHPAGKFFVPVVQSDMIFTALGEELGLAVLFAIIAIYLLIIYRGFRIALEASDTFNQLLAAGLTSIFAIQTLIIIAGNMKFFPLTGIPLPFLSYGGSSIIANYIIVGILLRISYNTAVERDGGTA